MKFHEYPYQRPDYEAIKAQMEGLLEQLSASANTEEFMKVFGEINKVRSHYNTMSTLSNIRHTINTKDPFYDKENDYWNEYSPLYQNIESKLYKAVLNCPFLEELRPLLPETFIKTAEYAEKSFREDIIPDLQEENKLESAYEKLLASAEIEFEGKTYNLSQLKALTESKDRDLRHRAYDARIGFFVQHEKEIDDIYDKMVHLRDSIAKKLGFKNFIELGYIRMSRFDYNEQDVANYRKQVIEHVVPMANKLYKEQQQRLGVDRLRYFDEKIEFLTGNPTPKGTPEEMVAAAQSMYHEMSPETGEFIDVMVNGELMDLVSKPGKAGGGYCTSLPDYKVPFIFSNFNGTSGDADVLTHEAGHAFQVYQSKDISVPECVWPTLESCEIFSMSMEFFAWPWSKNFFKEDTDKYHYLHLGSTAKFIPYGVLVDHFQHEVYANPDMTPDQRKAAWRSLEKQYLPHKDYEGCDILEKGCWWFQQGHIFGSPFYYIDYTLAQVCALEFWKRSQEKDPTAWSDYLAMCKCGGTLPFRKLMQVGNLRGPFTPGCLEDIMSAMDKYLSGVDANAM